MDPLKLATVWLGGCFGCHMSFLDLDEWLIDIAPKIDLVYSPIIDIKTYPEGVDVVLVEGAVANQEHLEQIQQIRRNTRIVVSFGDCAVTGNVTAMRNQTGNALAVLKPAYLDGPVLNPQIPSAPGLVPVLLDRVCPVHEVIPVDLHLPGCPPPAGHIRALLEQVLAGTAPQLTAQQIKFG